MNKRKIISAILIILAIAVAFGIAFTNAKYTSTVNGQASTSVAKYVFDVTGSDSYNYEDTIGELVLASTYNEDTLTNGKIAPGTCGCFEIDIDTTGAEVGIYYEITFENNSGEELPANLVFDLDGEKWSIEDGISGVIDANTQSPFITHVISWSWDYETKNGDELDTQDGINAFDYSYTIHAVGTQVMPMQG